MKRPKHETMSHHAPKLSSPLAWILWLGEPLLGLAEQAAGDNSAVDSTIRRVRAAACRHRSSHRSTRGARDLGLALASGVLAAAVEHRLRSNTRGGKS